MKRAQVGKTYRFQAKDKWALRSTNASMYRGTFRPDLVVPDVYIVADDVIMSLAPDMTLHAVRMGKEIDRTIGVWFYKGTVVYDTPIEAERNGGREDNIVNYLVEI